jgi:diguanylate cyclase (GGDEF)-like protein
MFAAIGTPTDQQTKRPASLSGTSFDNVEIKGNRLTLFAPVYQGGRVPDSVEARRLALIGWTIADFDGAGIVRDALGHRPAMALLVASVDERSSGEHFERTVRFSADGTWTARFTGSSVDAVAAARHAGRVVLLVGLTITALSFALLRVLVASRARALRLVDRKTDELRHQALHDALTGLPNRMLILDRAEQLLARAHRRGSVPASLFIDLDGFKSINDTLGHPIGDELLVGVAKRLAETVRGGDTVGRFGGDEFVVLVEAEPHGIGADIVAERLLDVIRQPFEHETNRVPITITASVGIAEGGRENASDLLRDADIALYEAKAAGKNCTAVFNPVMSSVVQQRLEMELSLRAAVQDEQLFLVYQPIFDLRTLAVAGIEALVRWRHPTRGVIQPSKFISVAEESGLINSIGQWTLKHACAQAAELHRHDQPVNVSVNISSRQLAHDELVDQVRSVLSTTGLDPMHLILEITESALMRDTDVAIARMRQLKDFGLRLAIDDFGTGYSSLSYLKHFPVDALKIDRSFISGLGHSPEQEALVRTLVQLGKDLRIETLAEGIEEHAELHYLQDQRCDSGQGFLLAPPLNPADLHEFLETHASRTPPAHSPDAHTSSHSSTERPRP